MLFAEFACCHDYFSDNGLTLKKEYPNFLFLGLIFSGSSSSLAPALCMQGACCYFFFCPQEKTNTTSVLHSCLLLPSPSLLDFPPKRGFLDTFFILWHSFQLHDLHNCFTAYYDSSLLTACARHTPSPLLPLWHAMTKWYADYILGTCAHTPTVDAESFILPLLAVSSPLFEDLLTEVNGEQDSAHT